MRRPLGAIDDQDGTDAVGGGPQGAEIGHGTGDVGDMRRGDDPGALRDEAVQGVEIEAALVGDRQRLDHRTRALGRQLPGDDVAVVLERGEQDLVAGRQAGGQAVGRDIERHGGAGGEDDVVLLGLADIAGHGGARGVEGGGCLVGQPVDAALDVGAGLGLEAHEGVGGRAADLSGRRVVEEVKGRLGGREDREVPAQVLSGRHRAGLAR